MSDGGTATSQEERAVDTIREALLGAFDEVVGYTSCRGCKEAHGLTGSWWDPGASRAVVHEEDCPLHQFQEALKALESLA